MTDRADLEAIRRRNEEFKRDLNSWYGDEGPHEDTSAAAADIDALLAEVERLRAVHVCEYAERGKGPCAVCDAQ
jgi:hypothetical protein